MAKKQDEVEDKGKSPEPAAPQKDIHADGTKVSPESLLAARRPLAA